ncbi:MAG: hypothetical protein BroJett003_15880 [Planctomycetota bacterium]|nr:MAG: hypothetical protein BroJett003_15880 [Planctomycetota bacterium]
MTFISGSGQQGVAATRHGDSSSSVRSDVIKAPGVHALSIRPTAVQKMPSAIMSIRNAIQRRSMNRSEQEAHT